METWFRIKKRNVFDLFSFILSCIGWAFSAKWGQFETLRQSNRFFFGFHTFDSFLEGFNFSRLCSPLLFTRDATAPFSVPSCVLSGAAAVLSVLFGAATILFFVSPTGRGV
ncbi:hypothetical protein RJT34_11071 [Clitoria ternatea]|uniref:Transmembrane protein n=1 Tax=Clitoria ternatea TaxID=43366 RepID=A0AAN9PJ56_CLITE